MDLLASILAYLCSVAAIVVALPMSYDAFVYAPLHPAFPQQTIAAAATPRTAETGATAAAKTGQRKSPFAGPESRVAGDGRTAPQADAARQRRERVTMARRRHPPWLEWQTREKEWAYQQAPQTLGFADEFPSGYGRELYR